MSMNVRDILKSKQVLNGGLFVLYSFLNKGIGFLLLIILASFIAPDEYGRYSLFTTVVSFLGFFISLSTDGYLSVSYFKTNKEGFRTDVTSIMVITMGMFILLSFLLLFIGDSMSCRLDLPENLLWVALVISLFKVFYNMHLNYLRIQEKVLLYGVQSCGYALVNFILALVLVVVLNKGWEGQVYAQFLCVIICGIAGLFLLIKSNLLSKNISKSGIVMLLVWGVPLIPHLATTWIRQGLDKYIINYSYSLTEVGIFSFALNLTVIIEMIGSSMNSVFSVDLFNILSNHNLTKEEKKQKLCSQTRFLFTVIIMSTIIIVVGVFTVIPFAMPRYKGSLIYFLILSGYGFFRSIYYLFSNYFFYWKKTKQLMYITVGMSLLHLFLSLVITRYSLYLTAGVYCITQFLTVAIVWYFANKMKRNYL